MRLALLLLVMVVAGSAHAETYKWVDDKGRVNYSNTPPPSAGKAKQIRAVEERVSVYQTDPEYERYLRQRAAQIDAAREAEWQERRRYLVAAQAAYPPADYNQASYYPDYYGYAYGYAPGYIVGGGQRHRVMHHVAHHVPHAAPRSGGSRGFGGGRGGGHR